MSKTIIVTTDFTASSRNALVYTCALASKGEYKLLLLHIQALPGTYTSDGVSLAAVKDAFDAAEDNLIEELAWAKEKYPALEITARTVVGGLLESLNDQVTEENPEVIVMGASNDYQDLWQWDSELLTALTSLPVPVLLIPAHIAYTTIANVGFACDYRNLCQPEQARVIKSLLSHTGAQLHVVHVTRTKPEHEEIRKQNEALLQDVLQDVKPKYYAIEDPNVIGAVINFVKEHKLDMLIVIPHKHDIWYSLFHQSHTRELAKLNHMPILALHD